MEWLGCLATFVGIAIFWAIINAIRNAGRNRSIEKTVREKLTVKCQGDQFTTDSGQKMDFIRVMVSGTCMVPQDNCPCRIHFSAIDTTDGEEEPLPILSLFSDMADKDGQLSSSTELTMPYQFTELTDLQVGVIVPEAIVLPKRGNRTIRIITWISPKASSETVYKAGTLDINYQQKTYGYLEQAERDLDADKLIVQLAVNMCKADGVVDKSEIDVIKKFFKQRMIHMNDSKRYSKEIAQTVVDTMSNLSTNQSDVHREIRSLVEKLLQYNDNRICQDGYELCAQIAAADNKVAEEEQLTLNMIAENLNISKIIEREIHDRYFSVNMFRERSRDALLDMPAGLSIDEQRSFLNQEYKKWSSRVTHTDVKIRTEAEMRIKQITERRREIDEKHEE